MKEKADMNKQKNDLLSMMVEERIDMLLDRKRLRESGRVLEEAELVIASLPEEQKEKIERWRDLSLDLEAENTRRVYLGGVMDGLYLAGKVYLIGMDGMASPEKWVEKFVV